MKILKLASLLMLAAVGVLAAVACTPAPGPPPAHSDELTDPPPVRVSPLATPATAASSPADNDPASEDEPAVAPAQVTASVADLLRQYLADTFGSPGLKAAWYDNVRQITVQFNTATIRTDLGATPLDQQKADTICRVVAAFPSSRQGEQRRTIDVQVYGQDGRLLASTHDVAARPVATDSFVAVTHDS